MRAESSRPSGPRVLAGVGVVLLLVAAISVVSDRWDLMGAGGRLAVLLAASAVVIGVTVPLRRVAPTTAQALDVLTAALLAVDVAAIAIVVGGSWRTALVAAGPATIAAAHGLAGRGHRVVSAIGVYAGGLLTVAGVAASFELAGALILTVPALGVAWFGGDARTRAVGAAWATTAGLAPALRVIDDVVFTGMGTLREMGLIDAAPIGEIVAIAMAASAAVGAWWWRDRSLTAPLAALAIVVVGGLDVWASLQPPATVGLLLVAVVVGLVELSLATRIWDPSPAAKSWLERGNEVALGAITFVLGAIVWSHIVDSGTLSGDLAFTAAAAAAVWLLGDCRRALEIGRRGPAVLREGGGQVFALVGFVGNLAASVYLATAELVATGIVLAAVGAALLLVERPFRDLTVLGAAGVSLLLTVDSPSAQFVAGLLAVGTASIVARSRMLRLQGEPIGALAVVVALGGGVAATAATVPVSLVWAGVVLLGAWWLVGVALHGADPALGWTFRGLALVGIILTGAGDHGAATVLALLLAAFEIVEWRRSNEAGHAWLGVGAVAMAWPHFLNALDVDLIDLYVVPLLWLAAGALVASGGPARPVRAVALAATAGFTVLARVVDPVPVHLAILGIFAVGAAVWAARDDDTETTGAAGALAAGAAVFELLDRAVGIETWGWLVVGGAAALTAAALIEGRGGRGERAPSVF